MLKLPCQVKIRTGVLYGIPKYWSIKRERSINREQVLRMGAPPYTVNEKMMLIITCPLWTRYLKWKLPFILLSRVIPKNLICSVWPVIPCYPIMSEWLAIDLCFSNVKTIHFDLEGKRSKPLSLRRLQHFPEYFASWRTLPRDYYAAKIISSAYWKFLHSAFLDSAQG